MSAGDDFDDEIDIHAAVLAEGIREGTAFAIPEGAWHFMIDSPASAVDVIPRIGREAGRETPDEALIEAYISLFAAGLEGTRYARDRGHDWAEELVDAIRAELFELAEEGRLPAPVLMRLLNAMIAAKLPPGEALTELLGKAMFDPAMNEAVPEMSEIEDLVEALIAGPGGNEFAVRESFDEATMAMPPQARTVLLDALMASDNAALRNTAVFSLLDPDPEVRRRACGLIADRASPEVLSAVALRRMIVVRNWLPEGERPHLDAAIRKARERQVECAPWPKRLVPEILATNMDGAGAQSVFAVTKDGRKFVLSALLVKQGVGIADAWCLRDQSKGEVRDLLHRVHASTEAHKVPADFVRLLASHYLAVGLASGVVPGVSLLEVVEATGIDGCQPAELSVDDLLSRLEADIEPDRLTDDAIGRTLEESVSWLDEIGFLQSWFEDDAEVDAVLARDGADDPDRVLESVMEPRRAKWTERFLWAALWLKQKRDRRSPWRDFFVVGCELHRGRPLRDIPVMWGIAEVTARLPRPTV